MQQSIRCLRVNDKNKEKRKEIIVHEMPVAESNGSHLFDWVHPDIEWVLPIRGPAKPRQLFAALLSSPGSSPSSVITDTPPSLPLSILSFFLFSSLFLEERRSTTRERERENGESVGAAQGEGIEGC